MVIDRVKDKEELNRLKQISVKKDIRLVNLNWI